MGIIKNRKLESTTSSPNRFVKKQKFGSQSPKYSQKKPFDITVRNKIQVALQWLEDEIFMRILPFLCIITVVYQSTFYITLNKKAKILIFIVSEYVLPQFSSFTFKENKNCARSSIPFRLSQDPTPALLTNFIPHVKLSKKSPFK